MAKRLVLPLLLTLTLGGTALGQELDIDLAPQVSLTLEENSERPGLAVGLDVTPGVSVDMPLGGVRTQDGFSHRTEINAPQITRNGPAPTAPAPMTPAAGAPLPVGTSLAELGSQELALHIVVINVNLLTASDEGRAMLAALAGNQDGIAALRALVKRRPDMSAALAASGYQPRDVVGLSQNGGQEIRLFVQVGS